MEAIFSNNKECMPKTCAHCGNAFEPMPRNRGYEQLYCSPQCRRKEAKRRGAAKTTTMPVHQPKKAHNEPIMSQDNEVDYGLIDDLCAANWRAYQWQMRYNKLAIQVEHYISRIEAKIDDI